MSPVLCGAVDLKGRPPHGGRGLKSDGILSTRSILGRPPHGGRGLKLPENVVPLTDEEVVLHTGDVD